MTTTTEGKTVPYIVRREMGTINRAIYSIAFLHEPGTPLPSPWTTGATWNGRLVYTFGGGVAWGYHQGRTIGGLNGARGNMEDGQLGDYPVAKGYALAGASLNVFGTYANDVVSAETMMMVKEHFIEEFGVPRYTIGSGRSGGSMQQHMIGNNYPGLLDAIVPTASFADTLTFQTEMLDCELLDHAMTVSKQPLTTDQKTAVSGYSHFDYCTNNKLRYAGRRRRHQLRRGDDPAVDALRSGEQSEGRPLHVPGRQRRTCTASTRRPASRGGRSTTRACSTGSARSTPARSTSRSSSTSTASPAATTSTATSSPQRNVADPDALRIAYETRPHQRRGARPEHDPDHRHAAVRRRARRQRPRHLRRRDHAGAGDCRQRQRRQSDLPRLRARRVDLQGAGRQPRHPRPVAGGGRARHRAGHPAREGGPQQAGRPRRFVLHREAGRDQGRGEVQGDVPRLREREGGRGCADDRRSCRSAS